MAVQVYYLGPPGTFGEQAALQYAEGAGLSCDFVPLASHPEIVRAVDDGDDDLGVVAVENSLGGAVVETMDAILASRRVSVRGELVLPIEQDLIAAPGTRLEDVSIVMSHPQALAQCRVFLRSRLASARLDAALSTVAAVEEAVRTPGAAAVANRRAAELHGGVVLAPGIQDVDNNKTRFFVLAHHDAPATGDDKTSLAFSVQNRPGSLVGAMRHLSDRGLNLTRVESRPSREELGAYIFLIDFQGHRNDANVKHALAALEQDGARLLPSGSPLGSYPRFPA